MFVNHMWRLVLYLCYYFAIDQFCISTCVAFRASPVLWSSRRIGRALQAAITNVSSSAAAATAAVELKHIDYCAATEQQSPTAGAAPVIFLHGLLGSKRNFATIGASLSHQLQVKRRLLGVDLRNHGENHHDWRDEMTYKSMAQDVLAFLDRQELESVVLIGHSMGGKVAQAVALLEPQRVEGLVVLDIAPVSYNTNEPHWKAVQDIVHVLHSIEMTPGMSKRDVDSQLKRAIPDPALRAFCLTNWDKGGWKIPLDSIVSQLDELAAFDLEHDEDASSLMYHGDAFFIHGGQSKFVRHAYMDAIAKYFPNHLLTTIRGAGHWVHAEAPDDTTALLKRFLDR